MKIKVTFEDIFNVESEEAAYDAVIKYCHDVSTHEDVTAFVFEEVEDHVESQHFDSVGDPEIIRSQLKPKSDASKFSFKDKKSVIVGLIEKGLMK